MKMGFWKRSGNAPGGELQYFDYQFLRDVEPFGNFVDGSPVFQISEYG